MFYKNTLKQILAITFIFLLILQPASRMYVIVSFTINQHYIEKNLCEKKEIKNNCCHGKCFLQKKLAKTEQPSSFPVLPKSTLEILFITAPTQLLFNNLVTETVRKNTFPPTILKISCSLGKGIFHPPQS